MDCSIAAHTHTLDACSSVCFCFPFVDFDFFSTFFVSIRRRLHKNQQNRCAYVIARNDDAHDAHCVCSPMRFLGHHERFWVRSDRRSGDEGNRFQKFIRWLFSLEIFPFDELRTRTYAHGRASDGTELATTKTLPRTLQCKTKILS